MEETVPPALVLGCNTPHGIGVLSDWIQEHTGVAPDFTSTAWSLGNKPGFMDGNGSGYGRNNGYGFTFNTAANCVTGNGRGYGYGDDFGDGGGCGYYASELTGTGNGCSDYGSVDGDGGSRENWGN